MANETFGEKLRRLRTESGLSQAALAKKAGLSQKAISFWELDQQEPNLTSLRKLCEALEVPSSTFVEETD